MTSNLIASRRSRVSDLFRTHPLFYGMAGLLTIMILPFLIWPGLGSRILSSNFLPHSYCYLGQAGVVWTNVLADSFIGLAYLMISGTLAYMIQRGRRDIPFHWMFLAFGAFIVACGCTHLMEVVTIWKPVYLLSAFIKVITALVSTATALWLPFTVPQILSLVQAAKASEAAQGRFRDLLEAAPDAIVVVDQSGRVVLINSETERLFGYNREEVLGSEMEMLIPESFRFEHRTHRMKFFAEPAPRPMGAKLELSGLRKAGTEFPIEVSLSPMKTEEGMLVTSAIRDITERKRAEEALASVSQRLIEAQDEERARISRDLHDDLGQRLALLTVQLDQLQQDGLDLPAEVRRRMGVLHKQTSGIEHDIRTLSHELHSSELEYLGIIVGMRSFCQEFGQQHNVEIDFKSHGVPGSLPPNISLGLFRVLQEALHNSAKHSGARHVEVMLQGTADQIHLTVKDAGRGFDREAAKPSRGLGLISMEERIKILHGTFAIDSRLNNGTTVRATVPLDGRSVPMAADK